MDTEKMVLWAVAGLLVYNYMNQNKPGVVSVTDAAGAGTAPTTATKPATLPNTTTGTSTKPASAAPAIAQYEGQLVRDATTLSCYYIKNGMAWYIQNFNEYPNKYSTLNATTAEQAAFKNQIQGPGQWKQGNIGHGYLADLLSSNSASQLQNPGTVSTNPPHAAISIISTLSGGGSKTSPVPTTPKTGIVTAPVSVVKPAQPTATQPTLVNKPISTISTSATITPLRNQTPGLVSPSGGTVKVSPVTIGPNPSGGTTGGNPGPAPLSNIRVSVVSN